MLGVDPTARVVREALRLDAEGGRERCARPEHGPDRTDAFLGLRECRRDDGGIDSTVNDVLQRDGSEDGGVFGTTVATRGNGKTSDGLTSAPKQGDHGATSA